MVSRRSGSIQGKKAATSTSATAAEWETAVSAPTFARPAEVRTQGSNVPPVITTKSPLNTDVLRDGLRNHPDRDFVDKIIDYTTNGVPIGYQGPQVAQEAPNWPSAHKFASAVTDIIQKDVTKGRKCGPFDHPPFSHMVVSPLGAFAKKRSPDKVRVIHDLSWAPGRSVNDHIPDDECSVQYISVDTAVDMVRKYGPGTLLAKIDLEDAFKHIVVRPEDWHLLGSSWQYRDANNKLHKDYYVDVVLPFGLRSSPQRFNMFADALQFIMLERGVTDLDHYLDDYITAGPPGSPICGNNLDTMLDTCKDTGFSVQPRKVVWPCTVLEFLGIIIDSIRQELRISEDRLAEVLAELTKWYHRRKCTKRELLSLIGKLTFVSRVVRSGRTFVRRMIELSKRVCYLHYKVTLNKEFQADIQWWLDYLPTWNGVSMFHDTQWVANSDLQLWTDASDIGYGAYFEGQWIAEAFTGDLRAVAAQSINYRELFAIVKAAATWGQHLAGKKVLFHCDNMAVVSILQSGVSRNTDIMKLVRSLFFVCACFDFECQAVWIAGCKNDIADALSRGQMDRFHILAPTAEVSRTTPAQVYGEIAK